MMTRLQWREQGDGRMTRSDLDRMLEAAVAQALGVELPRRRQRRTNAVARRASAPVTRRQAQRELHPA
jgi:hypothetical protein